MTNEQKLIEKQKEPNPITVLKERKKLIDRYVERLNKNGCKGKFVDDYKKFQKEFESAITLLEKEIEQVHTTCDGCAMMRDRCMLDDSGPFCFEHSQWTPKEDE